MLRPPEAFRESMERARTYNALAREETIEGYCMGFMREYLLARLETRELLSTLRALRESEREIIGGGK